MFSALCHIVVLITAVYAIISDVVNDKLGWAALDVFVFPVAVIRGFAMFFGCL